MNSFSKHGYPIEKAGRKRKPVLSENQIGYIVQNYHRMSDAEIARNLNLQTHDVFNFRTKNNFEIANHWKQRTPSYKTLAGFFDVDDYRRELATI